MKTLCIVSERYTPSTAQFNRILAFLKGFDELDVKLKVLLLMPDENYSKVKVEFNNVEFIYLWEGSMATNRYYIFIRSVLLLFKHIKRGDNVLLYYKRILSFLSILFVNVNLYHERTEHPDVVRNVNSMLGNISHKIYLYHCRKLKGLFVITNNLKDYFVSQGVLQERITVVNMVVDKDRFDNVSANKKIEKYIAYCGTVSVVKDGVDILVKVFHKVSSVVDDIKLYIIGGFLSDKDRDMIYNLVEHYNLTDKVVFTGKVDYKQMPQLLSDAQALILTRSDNQQSKYGFPTKLGEYLLTSCPVIITRVGEIENYLQDMKTALIANADDVDSLSSKIIWSLQNKEASDEIGRRGKEVALLNFSYKTEAKKVISVIFNKD